MDVQDNVDGILRARHSAASTLLEAVRGLPEGFSERDLADRWMDLVGRERSIQPYGWYQPPPRGVSVLIGTPPDYGRLSFTSLRSEDNWPQAEHLYSRDAVLYPYFSAIDRSTMMIGDHVGTYYAGSNPRIRGWIRDCYACTRDIADSIEPAMTFSEVFALANEKLRSLGARNNNFNMISGLASDIGHTIPFFPGDGAQAVRIAAEGAGQADVSKSIGAGREFVSASNPRVVGSPCALTIEPQIVADDLPMAGFHLIVIFSDRGKLIVEAYDDLFAHFGMSRWVHG